MFETWWELFCDHGADELSERARVALERSVETILAQLLALAADPWDEDSLDGLEAEVATIKGLLETEARR